MVSVLQPYTKLMKVLTEVQGLLVYRTANLDPVKKGFFFSWAYQHFSFLVYCFRRLSFYLSFTIVKPQQLPGFMLLLGKKKNSNRMMEG